MKIHLILITVLREEAEETEVVGTSKAAIRTAGMLEEKKKAKSQESTDIIKTAATTKIRLKVNLLMRSPKIRIMKNRRRRTLKISLITRGISTKREKIMRSALTRSLETESHIRKKMTIMASLNKNRSQKVLHMKST